MICDTKLIEVGSLHGANDMIETNTKRGLSKMVGIEEKRQKVSELLKELGNTELRRLIKSKCGATIADTTLYRMRDGVKTNDNTLHFIHYVLTH